jgi:hypothetical protein
MPIDIATVATMYFLTAYASEEFALVIRDRSVGPSSRKRVSRCCLPPRTIRRTAGELNHMHVITTRTEERREIPHLSGR